MQFRVNHLTARVARHSAAIALGLAVAASPSSAGALTSTQTGAQTGAAAPAAQRVDSTPPKNPDAVATRLYSEIASPYCPGMTLTSCPSDGAFRLKRRIRARLDSVSADVIMAELRAEFGPEIDGTTPAKGFGLVAWVAPFLGIVIGAIGITAWTRRSATRAQVAAPSEPHGLPALDESDEARLQAALRDES